MLADEPLDAAHTDAIALGQLPLRRTRGQSHDMPLPISLAEVQAVE